MAGRRKHRAPRVARAKVEVVIDRQLKRAWDEAAARLERAQRQGASAFDELWETVGAIIDHDPPLYLAAGFSTARAFLARYTHERERTAKRFIRVARYASPVEEERYGVAKLDAAIAYVEARLGAPAKERVPIDWKTLRIPVTRDGETRRLSLDEITVEELRAATRALTRRTHTPRPGTPPDVAAITRALPPALRREVRVSAHKDRIALTNIPRDALHDLARALAKARLR
jgi:hypothetical protein